MARASQMARLKHKARNTILPCAQKGERHAFGKRPNDYQNICSCKVEKICNNLKYNFGLNFVLEYANGGRQNFKHLKIIFTFEYLYSVHIDRN